MTAGEEGPDVARAASAGVDRPGARLLDLVAVMDRLRSPGGCPWDAAQTHASLVEYLVEESYETVEAIETGDRDGLREELGDLLLQVVFHARIAEESPDDPWSVDDVADAIVTKLVARHPHVFGDVDAHTAEQVEANWHALKAAEKGRTSVTDGIPNGLPALVLAAKTLSRAEKGGRDVAPSGAAQQRGAALVAASEDGDALGEALLGVVAAARARGWDAESELRAAVRRTRREIRTGEGVDPDG